MNATVDGSDNADSSKTGTAPDAERAGQAATLAEASSRLAGESGSIVADVVKTMQAIDASSPTSSASSTVSRFKPTSWR